MKSRFLLAIVLLSWITPVVAQQVPDRKDYIITSLQSQRNDSLDREALCKGESGMVIEGLKKEIADLKAQLAKAPAAAPAAPPP